MAIDKDVMNSIKKLTNKELFQNLKDEGFNIGPVIPSTRSVYEKKLYNFLTGKLASPTQEVIGDQPCVGGDDNDDDASEEVEEEEEGYDGDPGGSSFFKHDVTKGSGDFSGMSRLEVEDSFEEDNEGGGGNSLLNERLEQSFVSSIYEPSFQATDTDFTNAGDDDDDCDGLDDVTNKKFATLKTRRLYPDIEKPAKEYSEKQVDYFLKKYGPEENENSFDDLDLSNLSLDTSELRRRPLHSVRDVTKSYPASFVKVDARQKIKEQPKRISIHLDDEPLHEDTQTINFPPKPSNGILHRHHHGSNGVVTAEVVEGKRQPFDLWSAVASPTGVVIMILIVFVVLVFLAIEPQQELPKLEVPFEE